MKSGANEPPEGLFPFQWSGPHRRLLHHLTECQTGDWQGAMLRGQILVHGKFVGDGYLLKAGDRVTWQDTVVEPPIDTNWKAIHQDAHYVVVDKPARLPVHPTGAYRSHCLISLMESRYGKLYPLHRLDRETSGVIILARHSEAARLGAGALGRSQKIYVAAVHGQTPRRFTCDLPLGPKPGSAVRLRQGGWWHGQDAQTRFATAARTGGRSLVLAMPRTGRRHQIRAHLWESGFPVVGDKIYGPSETPFLRFVEGEDQVVDGLDRHFLHCWKIRFEHPILRKGMVWKSPLPPALQEAWGPPVSRCL